jgi:RNA recognition motif-containing protein
MSLKITKKNSEDKIVRGFAFFDKTWKQHSWNWNIVTNRGIETTEPVRSVYFGIVLSAGDAFLHCILNQALSDDTKETLSFIEKHTNEEKEELKQVLNIRLPQLMMSENAERIKILQMDPQIFVGGLAPHTTDQSLALHFSPYGVIKEAKVIYNRKTRVSKCYGFVTFAHPQSALTAVMNPNPIIDGKISNCNLASLKPSVTRNKKNCFRTGTFVSWRKPRIRR